jgi:hypothetical protein
MINCPICSREIDSDRGLRIHFGRCHKGEHIPDLSPKKIEIPCVPEGAHSVTLGTVIKLLGQCFCQDTENKTFSLLDAEGLSAKVVHKEFQQQAHKTFLFCSVYRSENLWAIEEEDVLNGKFPIISWAEERITEGFPVSPNMDIQVDSPFDPIERKAYLEAVEKYVSSRDLKSDVEKEYKRVDAEVRPVIIEYLHKYGVESVEGKGDNCLIDGGWETKYSNTPREPVIERDRGRIIQWLIDNNHEDCLKKVLDDGAWEDLKKSGDVPPEFLVEVEIPKKVEPERRLYIKKVGQ